MDSMIDTPAPTSEELPTGAERIVAERQRQIDVEGYSLDTDAGRSEPLLRAARCYLMAGMLPEQAREGEVPFLWPWESQYWKPSVEPVRNLEKAGALIAAAIDSLEARP